MSLIGGACVFVIIGLQLVVYVSGLQPKLGRESATWNYGLMMTQVCLSFSARLSHSAETSQVIESLLAMIEFQGAFL